MTDDKKPKALAKREPKRKAKAGDPRILSAKETRFVDSFLVNFNAAEASRACGNDPAQAKKTGNQMKGRPHVAKEIARRGDVTADELGLSRAFVLRGAEEIFRKSMEGTPVMDKDGIVLYHKWYPAGANKALETIARLRGDLIERKEVKSVSVVIKLEGVNPEDLI